MSRNSEMELENRTSPSVVEDEEPLLPVAEGGAGRKVEIGSWSLACLLLQHLSRFVPSISFKRPEQQYAQYWCFRICDIPVLYVIHSLLSTPGTG